VGPPYMALNGRTQLSTGGVDRLASIVRVFDNGGVLEAVERLRVDAAKCAEAPVWTVPATELIDTLVALHQLEQTVAAMKLHVVRQADALDVASDQRFRNTTAWLRSLLLLDSSAARQLVEQAAGIDRRPAVDAALSKGAIHLRQAEAITDALDALPTDEVPTDIVARAETALLDFAGEFAPAQLRRIGSRILEHVAPDLAERLEAAMLRRQEERAFRKRALTLSTPFEGSVFLRGCLTVEGAAVVAAALDPLCAPIAGDERTPAQRRADALVDVCRLALRTTELPENGGEPPQVAVTVAFDPLTRELASAPLDSGDKLSADAARRIACDAQILPVVLNGSGQVLDAGRTRRLAGGSLRRALVVRDRGCAFPGCDRPARWCDAHHVVPWSAGGSTSLSNLVLLCGHHHRLTHEGEWAVRMADDGLPEFLPPAVQDLARRPRHNRYHRRT
jgi:hypothetical protein